MICDHCGSVELQFLGEYYDSNYWCLECGSLNSMTIERTNDGSEVVQVLTIPRQQKTKTTDKES